MGNCVSDGTTHGAELDFGEDAQTTRERFEEAGQGHVFDGFDSMEESEQDRLLSQCR